VKGKLGDNLMYLAHRHEIEMEGQFDQSRNFIVMPLISLSGACEASLACTTCHVYVLGKYSDLLPEATEKEEDLLDLAPFLRDDSRLGQISFLSFLI
jgi:ferredoxin-2, mitochondrial